MKLCVECRHYDQPTMTGDFGICRHPNNLRGGEPCLIDGEPQPLLAQRDPYELRHFDLPDTCGKEGRWWEKKWELYT